MYLKYPEGCNRDLLRADIVAYMNQVRHTYDEYMQALKCGNVSEVLIRVFRCIVEEYEMAEAALKF
jgi:hypothetical protein